MPLAVYGTLRRGERNYRRLGLAQELRFIGPCRIGGTLLHLGPYPGLVDGAGLVVGELFAPVPAELLAIIDRFEGFDQNDPRRCWFRRERVWLASPRIEAWVYRYNERRPGAARGRIIAGGDWRRR